MNITFKRPLLVLPISLLGALSLLSFGALLPDLIPTLISASLTGNDFVDSRLKYQFVTFGIALLVLAVTYALAPQNARRFYKLGDLDAPAEPVNWLGIKPTDTWKTVGRSFAVIVSLTTGAFIYFNLARGQSLEPGHFGLLPFILVLSAMNAFTEEAITRLSVVTALDGSLSRPVIYLISALIFGIPTISASPAGSWDL